MTYLSVLFLLMSLPVFATDFRYSGEISETDSKTLERSFQEALRLVPQKFREGLPSVIHVNVKSYKGQTVIPDVCAAENTTPFTFGKYYVNQKRLVLNKLLVAELEKGPQKSKKISCQHKSFYDQAIATIIHELTHAYDEKNGKPSKSEAYLNLAGFRKIFNMEKAHNKDPMRSMDEYEMKNSFESFAVNMEYFAMDPEYGCRRPSLFNFFKKHFGEDPYPGKKCADDTTVMLTTKVGLVPYKIDLARVYRVDYLLASSGEALESGFGHSMFRIVLCAPEHKNGLTGQTVKATPMGPKCLEDKLFHIVGTFRANNDGATLNYMKGIFGGYPSMLFMMTLEEVLEEYNNIELRDLISYPIKFTEREKKDFLKRLYEVHWDYRGSYKFFTVNCATEAIDTLDVLTNERDKKDGNHLPKVTPKSVLTYLEQYNLVDKKDPSIQVFKGSNDGLINAYVLAYKGKQEDKALTKFVKKSKPDERMKAFEIEAKKTVVGKTQKEQLQAMKGLMVIVGSFSTIEQQVVRSKAGELQKKLLDYTVKDENAEKNPEAMKFFRETKKKNLDISSVAAKGYGIPQENEIDVVNQVEELVEDSEKMFEVTQKILMEIFPEEIKELEATAGNLKKFNEYGLSKRSEFRKLFETYLVTEIKKLAKTKDGKKFLGQVLAGGVEELRKKLGEELVTKAEVSDGKLVKLVQEMVK